MGDRSVDFATDAVDDPYRLDADGRPYDAVTELALDFMDDNKEEPFFLYMAHWLVHSPIQTRDLALLEYYCDKLGIPVPTTDANITTPGQTNPILWSDDCEFRLEFRESSRLFKRDR